MTSFNGMKGKIIFKEREGLEIVLDGVDMTLDLQNSVEKLNAAHRYDLGLVGLTQQFTFSGSFEAIRYSDARPDNNTVRTIRFKKQLQALAKGGKK